MTCRTCGWIHPSNEDCKEPYGKLEVTKEPFGAGKSGSLVYKLQKNSTYGKVRDTNYVSAYPVDGGLYRPLRPADTADRAVTWAECQASLHTMRAQLVAGLSLCQGLQLVADQWRGNSAVNAGVESPAARSLRRAVIKLQAAADALESVIPPEASDLAIPEPDPRFMGAVIGKVVTLVKARFGKAEKPVSKKMRAAVLQEVVQYGQQYVRDAWPPDELDEKDPNAWAEHVVKSYMGEE